MGRLDWTPLSLKYGLTWIAWILSKKKENEGENKASKRTRHKTIPSWAKLKCVWAYEIARFYYIVQHILAHCTRIITDLLNTRTHTLRLAELHVNAIKWRNRTHFYRCIMPLLSFDNLPFYSLCLSIAFTLSIIRIRIEQPVDLFHTFLFWFRHSNEMWTFFFKNDA